MTLIGYVVRRELDDLGSLLSIILLLHLLMIDSEENPAYSLLDNGETLEKKKGRRGLQPLGLPAGIPQVPASC